jgi:hypothetical protein
MTVDYELDRADLVAIANDQRHLALSRSSGFYYYGIIPALCAGLAIVTQSFSAAMIFTVLFISSGWLLRRWQYKHVLCSEDNLSFSLRSWRATLTDEGVSISSEAAVALYRWPFVREVFRRSHYVGFVITPLRRVHIPVRAFSGEEHIQNFITTAQSHLKSRTP